MTSPIDVLVITTDSPSGTEIIQHLKPVSSHIVAGTNLFSDFFGGMSDIFGGRSQSYQNQLTSIYNEAIEKVKHEAYKLGGNCVVGLRIDIDEISGKGKSMFMITAIGTAVILKTEKENEVNFESSNGFIGLEQIEHLKKLKLLIEEGEQKKLDLTNENWEFIIQNSVQEVYPDIIRQLKQVYDTKHIITEEKVKIFEDNVEVYLRSLKTLEKENFIYKSIREEGRQVKNFLKKFLKKYALLNIEKCVELLKDNDLQVRKTGLIVSSFDKNFYSKDDLDNYYKLVQLIETSFPKRGKLDSKTTMLSSQEKQIWICECGKSNKMEDEHCSKCGNDIYGFNQSESKPEVVVNYINKKLALIEELRNN